VTGYQWRSSLDGVLSTNASFARSSLSLGNWTIYFKTRCANGTWSPEASRSMTVKTPTAPSVALTAGPRELTYPGIVTLVATASEVDTTTATLWGKRVDRDNWENLGAITSPTGQFLFMVIPAYGYSYKVTAGTTESNIVDVAVRVPLGKPRANTTRVKVGSTMHLWGTIRPKHGAASDTIKYSLQWQTYNSKLRKWVSSTSTSMTIDSANDINSDTSKWVYDYNATSSKVGSWRVRFFHQCPRHKASYSSWMAFWVVK
jgi:hypothetical protein